MSSRAESDINRLDNTAITWAIAYKHHYTEHMMGSLCDFRGHSLFTTFSEV